MVVSVLGGKAAGELRFGKRGNSGRGEVQWGRCGEFLRVHFRVYWEASGERSWGEGRVGTFLTGNMT